MTIVYYTISMLDNPINHPLFTIFIRGINHSQMAGLWHCFTHIIQPLNFIFSLTCSSPRYCIMINGGTERYGWIMGVSDLEVCELRMPFAKKYNIYIYIYIYIYNCHILPLFQHMDLSEDGVPKMKRHEMPMNWGYNLFQTHVPICPNQ